MSFNSRHITPENYEEYLLLYVDNELTDAEREMVDAFLIVHPELQIELDMLMSTRLPEEDFVFEGREALLAHEMKKDDIDEQLLSYIDNELTPAEKAKLEMRLGSDSLYAAELTSLLKTKLDPEETIVYPNKQELYRHTRKVISFRMWVQVAAAVVFVVFVSGLYLTESYKDEPSFANNIMPGTTKEDAVPAPVQTVMPPVNDVAAQTKTETPVTNNENVTEKKAEIAPAKTYVVAKQEASPAYIPTKAAAEPVSIAKTERNLQPIRTSGNNSPEIDLEINEPVVTSAITASYNVQEPRNTSVVATESVKTKGSLKGFLRKATRIIEKNTGIGATNEDNELLIGALAVKL